MTHIHHHRRHLQNRGLLGPPANTPPDPADQSQQTTTTQNPQNTQASSTTAATPSSTTATNHGNGNGNGNGISNGNGNGIGNGNGNGIGIGNGNGQSQTSSSSTDGGFNIPGFGFLTQTSTQTTPSISTTSTSTSTTSTTSSTTTATSTSKSSISTTSSHSTTPLAANTPVTPPSSTLTVTSTPQVAASSTSTAQPDGSSNTGTLVGAIGGAIIGVAVFVFLVGFVIRWWRRRADDAEAFSASQFRQSAVMLDDDAYIPEDPSPFAASPSVTHGGRGARPPTMIERHMAHTPALPPATYSPGPFNAYGAQQSFAYQQQQFPEQAYEHQPYTEQQQSWSPGEALPSPHSPPPEVAASPTPLLNRQPSSFAHVEQYYSQPEANAQYVDLNREPAAVTHAAPPVMEAKRPDTVYDPEDAYGGM